MLCTLGLSIVYVHWSKHRNGFLTIFTFLICDKFHPFSSLICTISRTAQDSRFLEALFLFSQCAPQFVSNPEQETFAVCLIVTETVLSKKLSTGINFRHNFNSTIIVSRTSKNTKIAGYFLFQRVDKHLLKL